MGNFGGETAKRHRLYSNDYSMLNEITQKAGYMCKEDLKKFTKTLVVKYVDILGVQRRVGKKKELRDSQNLGQT